MSINLTAPVLFDWLPWHWSNNLERHFNSFNSLHHIRTYFFPLSLLSFRCLPIPKPVDMPQTAQLLQLKKDWLAKNSEIQSSVGLYLLIKCQRAISCSSLPFIAIDWNVASVSIIGIWNGENGEAKNEISWSHQSHKYCHSYCLMSLKLHLMVNWLLKNLSGSFNFQECGLVSTLAEPFFFLFFFF